MVPVPGNARFSGGQNTPPKMSTSIRHTPQKKKDRDADDDCRGLSSAIKKKNVRHVATTPAWRKERVEQLGSRTDATISPLSQISCGMWCLIIGLVVYTPPASILVFCVLTGGDGKGHEVCAAAARSVSYILWLPPLYKVLGSAPFAGLLGYSLFICWSTEKKLDTGVDRAIDKVIHGVRQIGKHINFLIFTTSLIALGCLFSWHREILESIAGGEFRQMPFSGIQLDQSSQTAAVAVVTSFLDSQTADSECDVSQLDETDQQLFRDRTAEGKEQTYIVFLGQRLDKQEGKLVATGASVGRALYLTKKFNELKDTKPVPILLGGDAAGAGITESQGALATLEGKPEVELTGEKKPVTVEYASLGAKEEEEKKNLDTGAIKEQLQVRSGGACDGDSNGKRDFVWTSDDQSCPADKERFADWLHSTAFMDMRSRFTFTNAVEMFKLVIGTQCPTPIKKSKFFLVSNAFHLPRAQYIFEQVKINADLAATSGAGEGNFLKMFTNVLREHQQPWIEGGDAETSLHDKTQLKDEEQLKKFIKALAESKIVFEGVEVPDAPKESQVKAISEKTPIQLEVLGKPFDGKAKSDHKATVDGVDYNFAKFKKKDDGSLTENFNDVDASFCALNPYIWKNSNAFNRIEVINWNAGMMVSEKDFYDKRSKKQSGEFGDLSYCDAELQTKGGMTIDKSSEPVKKAVVAALETYAELAKKYHREGERLTGEDENSSLCPEIEAALAKLKAT